MKIMKQGFSMVRHTCETLSQALQEWSRLGRGSIIWPYVLDMAKYLNYDWDTMYDSLCLMVAEQDKQIPQDLLYEYQSLLNKLEKQDFFSRYIRAGKHYKLLPYEDEKIKLNYVALGKEMAKEHLYTVGMLVKIYGESPTHNYQFGSTVAGCLSVSEQRTFITNSIEALNAVEHSDAHTLIDFLRMVEEDIFKCAFEDMRKLRNKSALFASVGARGYPLDHPYVEELFQMVREGCARVEQLKNFYHHYPVEGTDPEGVRLQLLRRISVLPKSLPIVLELGQLGLQGRILLVEFLEELLLNSMPQLLDYANDSSLSLDIEGLLHQGGSSRLASALCQELMTHYSDWNSSNVDVPRYISLLLSKHFDSVWPAFSIALLGEDEDTNEARLLLQLDIFQSRKIFASLLQDPSHEAKVLTWCDEYPDRAPASIMPMLPLYNEGEDRFSGLVMELLSRYGNQEDVLNSLGCNMGSFSWVGSLVPLYKKQLSCITPLTEHPIEAVRVWARRTQCSLKEKIRRETNTDEERSALYR